ncbi:MAG: stage V sporulation protein AB [Eubacteriales bacterium]|nr:stage V sporulation protein AB [Eubacteriales bacterium]MDD3881576.1 stage V sporulation protein AB [Eubacteriales bacterium]MDD4513354.1 stage V sporulation protein AB [Eubacteriales bacterium]
MLSIIIGLLSGVTIGVGIASIFMTMSIPMRLCEVFHLGAIKTTAWVLFIGIFASAVTTIEGMPKLPLGAIAGSAAMLFGGAFVGILASALSEMLDVVPPVLARIGVVRHSRIIITVLALGKSIGAFVACVTIV